MQPQTNENAIFRTVISLNADQKEKVLDYLSSIYRPLHSTKRYKRRAMKQIRQALSNPI